MMNAYPPVGIGILNWNGCSFLKRFLPYLTNITYPNYTIYVFDNASSDNSIGFLKEIYPDVKVIHTGGNLGVAGGYNYGFANIPEEYVVMLNSDVEVTPNFLEPLVNLMQSDDRIAFCQSKLLDYRNRNHFEYGGAGGGMIDILGYSFCRGRVFNKIEEDRNQYKTGDIFWVGGACAILRRSIYNELGGMYEYFRMHFEEIDLCWRMHTHNYKLVYCNESVAYHMGGGSLSYQSPKKTFYNFRNNLVMCFRNSSLLFLLWWFPIRVLLDLTASVRFLAQREPKYCWAVIHAYVSFVHWFFTAKNKFPDKKTSLTKIPIVLKSSVAWAFYISKKKTFTSIIHGNEQKQDA